ncbi:MAG TPA: zinc-ribbon domain-containing protein [Candidatus Sulfotelmatobacter sp.]|nr:zinc-ribbon domain-containing protein [Candidatus Sulfotelmatobacter sp.]
MDQTEVELKPCPHCAAQMPETASFCPGCGRSMAFPVRAQGTVGVFPENIAGALAYLSFIPAILFLLLDPYRKNRFVRFHSVQCIGFWIGLVILAIALKLVGMLLFIIPVLGPLLVTLIDVVAILAAFVIWLVLIVKALQGEPFQLPLLGDFAEQQSGDSSTPPEN